MPESWSTRIDRWRFNLFPAYRGTGARLDYIAADWREVHVRLPLSWRTRNYVGTIFGGSLYGSIDPIYMLMLIRNLGPAFVVWDKSATIRFLRPGRTTLFARFTLSSDTIAEIAAEATRLGKVIRDLEVELMDATGQIHATCSKTLYIRWKGER
jgi:acyl-coenzyme A thioesterase PaaI-like protein